LGEVAALGMVFEGGAEVGHFFCSACCIICNFSENATGTNRTERTNRTDTLRALTGGPW
jgi:hypothetical protein